MNFEIDFNKYYNATLENKKGSVKNLTDGVTLIHRI